MNFTNPYRLGIDGMPELKALMENLPHEINHKIIGSAMFASATPIVDSAKSKIRNKTGNLSASIGRKKMTLLKSSQIGEVRVGPRLGGGYKGYHGWLVEKGHRVVKGGTMPSPNTGKIRPSKIEGRTGRGFVVGQAEPHEFLEPAFKESANLVYENFSREMGKAYVRVFKKYLKNKVI